MSILKRKASSLDPLQKQKKNRQTQYFALIDKCLQIPCDDKLIIRKNIEDEEQRLISLLQKYRKQGSKDLKQLQIYLRKYIQKYKLDHPKYPTLKFAKNTESSFNFQKRNSLSFSVNTSKMTFDLGRSNSHTKDSIQLSNVKIVNSPKFKLVPNLKLNTKISKQQQRNYQELIRKRKTQKLKISQHRVSVTIQNQSLTSNISSQVLSNHKYNLQSKLQNTKSKLIQSQKTQKNIQKINVNQSIQNFKQVDQNKYYDKPEFLETMRFRMKIDDEQQIDDPIKFEVHNIELPIMTTNQSILDTQLQSRISSVYHDNLQNYVDVRKKLFSNSQTIINSKISQSQDFIKIKQNLQHRKALGQLSFQSNTPSIKEIVQKSQYINSNIFQSKFEKQKQKENFNSGKKMQDKMLIKSINKDQNNQSLFGSHFRDQSKYNINSLSTINKQNQQNQIRSQYLKSQRKISDLYSHRLLEESKYLVNSFAKDQKENKSSKSSRMIFSHRMEQIISGRKIQKENTNLDRSQLASPSYSFREKKKAVNKLEFWARIQSTINE